MNIKRLFSLALAVALIAALAVGCTTETGNGGNTGSKTGSATGEVSASVEEIYGEGLSQDTVDALQKSGEILAYTTTIDFANNKFDKDPVMQKFNEWAKKYYGLTVKYRYRAWTASQMEKFLIDYANNDAPDILTLNYFNWPKAGLRQVVYNTDELAEKGVVGLDHPALSSTKEANERWSVGDKCYAVSGSGGQAVIGAVNLDLFEQYKVKSPVDYYKEGTWDMDAYIKCCKELTRTLADVKIWGGYAWNYNWYLVANDARLISWDNTRTKLVVTMNDPKTIRGAESVQALYTGGYSPLSEPDPKFKKGQMGVYFATTQNLASLLKDCTFKWDVVPFPYGADNTSGEVPGEPQATAVVTSTKNPQGAVSYIIARRVWKDVLRNSDIVPANDFYNTPGYTVFNEKQVAMYEAFDNMLGVDLTLGTGTLNSYYQFWNDLRDGSKTLKECIDTYKSYYQEQATFENEEAAKVKR